MTGSLENLTKEEIALGLTLVLYGYISFINYLSGRKKKKEYESFFKTNSFKDIYKNDK